MFVFLVLELCLEIDGYAQDKKVEEFSVCVGGGRGDSKVDLQAQYGN